jgi:hypothetical protein
MSLLPLLLLLPLLPLLLWGEGNEGVGKNVDSKPNVITPLCQWRSRVWSSRVLT